MVLILISLIAVTSLSVWTAQCRRFIFLNDFIAPFVAIFGFVGLLIYGVVGYGYFAAEYKANIINREYKTNYSQIEVFYASDVIETIRELNRTRVEINGNLITGNNSK